ncbi:MAG: hypothetical protein NVSMB9_20680 [Isosphaeraceae bacterium]
MSIGTGRKASLRSLASLVCLPIFIGCSTDDPLERAGVSLRLPPGWRRVSETAWPVPGTPLAAWSAPGGSSLVIYQTLPAPGMNSSQIAEGHANRLKNLPGLRIGARTTELIGGVEAIRLTVSAPGTGDALAPSGRGLATGTREKPLIPTRRILDILARPNAVLFLVWHNPEDSSGTFDPRIHEIMKSLKIAPQTIN